MTQAQETLGRLIHLSGRLLDQQDFEKYAALYADAGEYRLVTKAPEVAQPMTWVLFSRDELGALFDSASQHVWNTGERNHLITVEEIDIQGDTAQSKAGFCVFRTSQDGATEIFAVGRYEDRWQRAGNDWRLLQRLVHLQTRLLASPSAIPI